MRIPVQDVPLRQLQPEQVVVDEARQRLLVRGVTKDALGYVTSRRVDVYTYEGVFLQELVLDAPADHLLLTADQAHLLVVQGAQDRITVLDATTLLRVGAIATDPGLDSPGQVDLVGTDLVLGHSQRRVAVPLADPTAVRRIGSFDFFDSEQIVADVSRPGTAYVRPTTFGSLSAYDLRTTPPTRLAGAEASGGWFSRDPLVPNGDGPIRLVEGSIVEHDRETMVRIPGWREMAQGPRDDWGVKGAAAGPAPELLLTLSGFDSARSAVIGPIPVIVDGVLEVWDDAATPFRTIDILHVPEQLGATASGSHAFVLAGRHVEGETGDRTGRHWLTTVVDPYARCSVRLDPLPASVRTGQAVAVQGRVEVPTGTAQPPHVLVSVGTVHVQATVAGDGRFSTSITPSSPSATAIEAAVPQDVLGGCRTAAAVEVLDGFLAPFESAAALVDRQTQDLLAGIAPTDARAWLIDQVATQAISPGALITWLAAMSDPVHGALARLHLGALGRWPTSAELQARVAAMQQGRTLAQVAADLQATKEFTRRFGQPDDGAFVTALYRTLLGRDPTAAERSARLGSLARGGTRGQALLAVTQSTTYVRRVAPFVEVELVHLGMLRRNPTADEAWSWLVDRSRGVPAADLVDQIRFGAAYGERIRGLL